MCAHILINSLLRYMHLLSHVPLHCRELLQLYAASEQFAEQSQLSRLCSLAKRDSSPVFDSIWVCVRQHSIRVCLVSCASLYYKVNKMTLYLSSTQGWTLDPHPAMTASMCTIKNLYLQATFAITLQDVSNDPLSIMDISHEAWKSAYALLTLKMQELEMFFSTITQSALDCSGSLYARAYNTQVIQGSLRQILANDEWL